MKNVNEFLNKQEITYQENVSFKRLTTYRCGGKAKYVVFPDSDTKLKSLLKYLKDNNIKYKVFGNGSNILASEKDYDGVIIKLTKFNKYTIDNDVVTAQAGVNLSLLANELSKNCYSGLEFACGIPGTVGGAIYMNAGAYLKDIASLVIDVTLLDENLNVLVLKKEDLNFSYRSSLLQSKNYICLEARLKLEKQENNEQILTVVSNRLKRRLSTQPLDYPSAGSVFRNPEDDFAGRLVEECNLKGKIIGGAMISDKHANFIINKDNAKATDIKQLMDLAQEEVYKKFNVKLRIEQELFNWE